MTAVASTRTQARELTLQALYMRECGGEPGEKFENVLDEEGGERSNLSYAQYLYRLAIEHEIWADEQISALAQNWELARIAVVDRIVLRMALVEMVYGDNIPPKVVMNEAIELAKRFSTPQSPGFVNGLLDGYAKLRTERPDRASEEK